MNPMLVGRRLLAAAAFCLAVPATAQSTTPAPGSGFDVIAYKLSITPDPAAKAVAGTEEIVFRSTVRALTTIAFSPNALTIDEATIDGRPVRVDATDTSLVFILNEPATIGRPQRLRIRYHGIPARGVTATSTSMYTSYFACDWMVCLQDSPGDKALFALELRLPDEMASLSIGKLVATDRRAGQVVHRWQTTRPCSPYLFGFAIGHFARHIETSGGDRLAYYGEGVPASELARRFADTPAMVRFLSDKAGVTLPDRHYTQLLVPGREAQEAATYALIGRGELDREADDPQAAWAIVHELAHQWWGNLVTCATWRDFWLNEGVVTFMTAAWKEHRFGAAAYQAELAIARRRLATAREAGWDRPLAFAGNYPSLGTRRAIQYSKGALFMDHLRTRLGEQAFWRGLKAYTRAHAGGIVTSIDLQRAMERASGQDLTGVFAEWVFG